MTARILTHADQMHQAVRSGDGQLMRSGQFRVRRPEIEQSTKSRDVKEKQAIDDALRALSVLSRDSSTK